MTPSKSPKEPSSETLFSLFKDLYEKKTTPEKAFQAFKFFPYEDLGFAKTDNHRRFRTGLPEVILCDGKTAKQVALIAKKLYEMHGYAVASRATEEQANYLKKTLKNVTYHEHARMVVVGKPPQKMLKTGITILTGGTSDIPVAEEAAVTAELLGNQVERIYDVGVAGIHRLLDKREIIEKSSILIVVAGMEGALPSVVAGLFGKPIIAIPTSIGYGSHFGGLSALLTMLNSCALGIAVVNIDNGFGAGYLASSLNNLKGP